jgi:hypothetical protein
MAMWPVAIFVALMARKFVSPPEFRVVHDCARAPPDKAKA